MPLIELSGLEAVESRKKNAFAAWGNRTQPNRVEPIAKPSFDVAFEIEQGEKIFTVGSCFARNVEMELLRRGFDLPMRSLFRTEAFRGLDPGVVNNFGTPSIYNEFAWALGARPFVADDHIVEVQTGKFVDLHVISSIRPDRREIVEARRQAITEAYRSVLDCRVLIMTLGLVEVWFDSRSGYYLNSPPLPSMLRAEPDRFRLHVLSFEETYKYLEDALLLVRSKGRSDLRVILTVSPVPLAVTHRRQDVMVANCYSKSVLRAVAETITYKHDFITYYPSYESVILSDRKTVWRDDFTHVTDEIVAVNVGRMIDAYVRNEHSSEDLRSQIEAGGLAVAVEKARSLRQGSSDVARQFFADFGHLSTTSLDFALEEAQFLISQKEYASALAVLDGAAGGPDQDKTVQIAADLLMKLGRPAEAYQRLDVALSGGNKAAALWNLFLRSAMALGDVDRVLGVLGRWIRVAPIRTARANALVARWFHERGEFERALNYFKIAAGFDQSDALGRIYHVETLMALGRLDEATDMFRTITPQLANEIVLHGRLAKSLGVPV